ncbi:MAG: 4Fe-4S dicluster domain-containing protein [Candidatus Diapherotrites archaeon]|nr:4Fe-4S dicluster domain-containing protein [Candidatus Diapherotrites archaeon]
MKIKGVPSKCTGCKLCLTVCSLHGLMVINPERAGGKIRFNGFETPSIDFELVEDNTVKCAGCKEAVEACPTGALYLAKE